jgi:hypothetical protein
MRTLFRRNKDRLNASLDLIMIAKPGMPESTWDALLDDYMKAVLYINKRNRSE